MNNKIGDFPAWVVALDAIGTVMLGLGLYSMFAESGYLDLRDFSWGLVIGGALLMLPMLGTLINRVKNNTPTRD